MSISVEIWSDVICPFCYIGKRHFEEALKAKDLDEEVEITWRSFELAPDAETNPDKSIYEVLSERKGWSSEQTKMMHEQVSEKARQAGLNYDFDSVIPANSFNAHRILHAAKSHGSDVQDDVKEHLLRAYFTEGKNIDDASILKEIGTEHGLSESEVSTALESEEIKSAVEEDISLARQIGIQGVPFFVFNRTYAVSGAQPVEAFKEVLGKIQVENVMKPASANEGDSCAVDDPNC
jgi:predicted DsbA family dithiol-disulfide isomerase